LEKAESNQMASLQKELNNVKVETNQLIEDNKKTAAEAIQTEQEKLLEVEKKLTAQVMTNKVQEQTIERLKEQEEKLEKEIENKEKIIRE